MNILVVFSGDFFYYLDVHHLIFADKTVFLKFLYKYYLGASEITKSYILNKCFAGSLDMY